jgi:predicted AAA+ superfamily ATPase
MLELYREQGDLSRRLSTYHLAPLSFREFLELEYKIKLEPLTLGNILKNHIDISRAVCDKIRPLAYFKDYMEYGALPFYRESRSKYHERLINIVNMTLDYDLPSISPIDYSHVVKLKQLLKIISDLVPYKPNISKLAAQTGIDRKTVLKYLDLLKRSELTMQVNYPGKSDSVFTKPEKIYLGNPNFMFSLCDEKPNSGTLRETFFAQQLSVNHSVTHSKISDFLIDNTYTFEIGGKNKDYKQISETENSYIAADEIEYGFGNKIPLWMFGLMY